MPDQPVPDQPATDQPATDRPAPSTPFLSRDHETSSEGRALHWSWLGRRRYRSTWDLQEQTRAKLQRGLGPERFFLVEHDPVFTLGRNASEQDIVADAGWLAKNGVEVIESNRGGQVTYHGPGQLVGYPIVDLRPDRRDVGRYVRDLQEVLIRSLADHGVTARRREGKGFIGVWTGEGVAQAKIASIGVHLARWVTIHGFALNVQTQLEHFGGIVACGLQDVTMTSMEAQLGAARTPPLETLAETVASHFAEIFQRQLIAEDPPALET